jgi:hypothetical protein
MGFWALGQGLGDGVVKYRGGKLYVMCVGFL